jgi:hypothetical protein
MGVWCAYLFIGPREVDFVGGVGRQLELLTNIDRSTRPNDVRIGLARGLGRGQNGRLLVHIDHQIGRQDVTLHGMRLVVPEPEMHLMLEFEAALDVLAARQHLIGLVHREHERERGRVRLDVGVDGRELDGHVRSAQVGHELEEGQLLESHAHILLLLLLLAVEEGAEHWRIRVIWRHARVLWRLWCQRTRVVCSSRVIVSSIVVANATVAAIVRYRGRIARHLVDIATCQHRIRVGTVARATV